MISNRPNILAINIAGQGKSDELRVNRLLENIDANVQIVHSDRSSRGAAMKQTKDVLRSSNYDLVYLENTGIAAGIPLIQKSFQTANLKYIVSAGDPVSGYFAATQGPVWGAAFSVYEKLLYRRSSGFVGWTPYLTGRALALGAPRAATVEGAVRLDLFSPLSAEEKIRQRAALGIGANDLVCGVIGSMTWARAQNYCYGLELVEMMRYLHRPDLHILLVGDGDGRKYLEERIDPKWSHRVHFTGRVAEKEVVNYINVMDIGFITQTLDQLGLFRLTTKLPEYLACGTPVAMSPIPGYFDYVMDAGWSLPPLHPASKEFHQRCAVWADSLSTAEIADRAAKARSIAESRFGYPALQRRFVAFLQSVLEGP